MFKLNEQTFAYNLTMVNIILQQLTGLASKHSVDDELCIWMKLNTKIPQWNTWSTTYNSGKKKQTTIINFHIKFCQVSKPTEAMTSWHDIKSDLK